MKDAKLWLERLKVETEELRLISRLATDPAKRAKFAQLADQHQEMADDLQATIDANRYTSEPKSRRPAG